MWKYLAAFTALAGAVAYGVYRYVDSQGHCFGSPAKRRFGFAMTCARCRRTEPIDPNDFALPDGWGFVDGWPVALPGVGSATVNAIMCGPCRDELAAERKLRNADEEEDDGEMRNRLHDLPPRD